MSETTTEAKTIETPAEILLRLLGEEQLGEGFNVPLEDEFKSILITMFAKEEYLPNLSFTNENGVKLFKLLDKSGYIAPGTALLSLFEQHEAKNKYGKATKYLTPKGGWLKGTNIKATVPNELDVVAGQ